MVKDIEYNPDNQKLWEAQWKAQRQTIYAGDVWNLMDEIKFDYLTEILPEKGRTVEVGAGSGRLSCMLASKGYETVCIDYSKEAVRVAKNNYEVSKSIGEFIIGNAYSLPFKDNSFDVIMSTGLLEHFENPIPIVSEMVRVLKRGGLFYSDIAPSKFSLLTAFSRLASRPIKKVLRIDGSIYESKISKDDVEKLLRTSGLDRVTVFPAGVFPPYIPLLDRARYIERRYSRWMYKMKSSWKKFDKTKIADAIGFYYFSYGWKK
jgi:2-polyprenyl-3-methyl-5-hydroxy-6-metoxy-1,4-benzoquinol methylase